LSFYWSVKYKSLETTDSSNLLSYKKADEIKAQRKRDTWPQMTPQLFFNHLHSRAGGMTQGVESSSVGSLVLEKKKNQNPYGVKLLFPKQKQPKMTGSLYLFSIPEHYFLRISSTPLAPSIAPSFCKQFWGSNPGLGHARQALHYLATSPIPLSTSQLFL
jgi:hypothetical protein